MPNARPHEYDLRRFPSKYAGKCPGCQEWYEEGAMVLWGKPGGKSVTYHDNPDCVPRNLTFDPSGGQQVPRSHTEAPKADVGGGHAPGGHAESEPNADSHVGQRLLMAKVDAMNATLRGLQDMVGNLHGKIESIIAAIEKAPF